MYISGNIAANKPSTQSSLQGYSVKANDGNRNPNYGGGSCSETSQGPNPWWQVDLERAYVIHSVVAYNRDTVGECFMTWCCDSGDECVCAIVCWVYI